MTRLRDTATKKRHKTSGSYGRLFSNEDIGLVISDIQSTAIRNGNELEQIIERNSNPLTNDETTELIDSIRNEDMPWNHIYLLSKNSYRGTELAIPNHEPDYIVIKSNDGNLTAIVIEMKDGDDFDTKKSNGELETLISSRDFITKQLGIETSYSICCFNQTLRKNIVRGLKHRFDEEHVMTGFEFCQLIGIDYSKIVTERESDAADNVTELAARLLACDAFVSAISSLGYVKSE